MEGCSNSSRDKSEIATIAQTGPPLPKTLQLLAPLAATLEELNLGGNKLGGAITDGIAPFTKLTELSLGEMDLRGAWMFQLICRERRASARS